MGNKLLDKFRFKLALMTRGLGYSENITEQIYERYLNHHKIIHFRNGFPVYSLSSPALFSKPMANFISGNFYGLLQNRKLPNMLSFAVSDDCDMDCAHCSFFEGVADPSRKPLSLDECRKFIKDVQSLGVSVISFTGGEPLDRKDICPILSSVDKDLSTTLMFTNGYKLENHVRDLKNVGLDSIYVSIDSADPEIHDHARGVEGSFNRALQGIQAAKKHGFSIGISSCVFPDSISSGNLEGLIQLGKKLEVHEILIFCATPSGRLKDREDLINNTEWIDEIIEFTEKYSDDKSYPGILSYNYNSSYKALGCSGGTRWMYASPYGDISPCDFNHYIFGNIRERPLHEIWDEMSSTEPFDKSTWGGCKLRQARFRKGPFEKYIKP